MLFVALLAGLVAAQVNKQNSLTPDAYWHNRYHALLTMSSYGDYNVTCPNQTFTEAAKDRNFPNSPFPPWTVVNTFGPTASGAEGFTAIAPEMNKALIIFKGNYTLEQNLPTETADMSLLNPKLAGICKYFGNLNGFPGQNCTVNAFALQGYLEAKEETNDWQEIIQAYSGAGLVFSIAGHGLGGMQSIMAALDLNTQNISYYHHTYGTPRTLNGPGAWYYNYNFWGESGERGIANDDTYTEFIPESTDYVHAGTPFYYSGFNNTALGPDWTICWDVNDPSCSPQPTGTSSALQDHYFYFANVGQCGGEYRQDLNIIDTYLESIGVTDFGVNAPAGPAPVTTQQNPAPVVPQVTTSTTYYQQTTTYYPNTGVQTFTTNYAAQNTYTQQQYTTNYNQQTTTYDDGGYTPVTPTTTTRRHRQQTTTAVAAQGPSPPAGP